MVKYKNQKLDLIFQALAHHTRRDILKSLSSRERAIGEIAEPFKMSLVAVSKHVKILERAQLIRRRWDGNFSYIKLNPKTMKTADEWIEYYRQFWEQSLDRLDQYLQEEKNARKEK